jgi:hypothetical protein
MVSNATGLSGLLSTVAHRAQSIIGEIESLVTPHPPRVPRFAVARMGSTGSTWFAKLLNSHPEVYCSHEGVAARAYPARTYGSDDIIRFVDWLACDNMHGAYAAIGDVGSIWQSHAPALRGFQTALLVRHPARLLRTRLITYPMDQSFTEINADSDVCELRGIVMAACEPLDRVFLHDLHIFAAQAWGLDRGIPVIRIEDMTQTSVCLRALRRLTGIDYDPALVERANRKRVNQHATPVAIPEIIASFTPRQREWYRLFLDEAAPLLGYDLDRDVPPPVGA